MKVTINTTELQSREIDWDIPMIVNNGKYFVLTTGVHQDDTFCGFNLERKEYVAMFMKSAFTPCTTPVTITFENEL